MTDAQELDWWRRTFSTRFHDGSLPKPGTALVGRRFRLVDEAPAAAPVCSKCGSADCRTPEECFAPPGLVLVIRGKDVKMRLVRADGLVVDERAPAPEPAPPPAVDRSAITSLHGTPVDELRAQHAAQPTGMHADYIVLTDAERAKGFVRPVRRTYRHLKCGSTTTMGIKLAETYARDPKFYGATFCCNCDGHFPVGAAGEFVWDGTLAKVGT